jgi:hypothetical protein
VWNFWSVRAQPDAQRKISPTTLKRLQQEFEGAAAYLSHCFENNIDLPPQAEWFKRLSQK